MRSLALLLVLAALAACEARPGAVSGPTLSVGGGLGSFVGHSR